MGSNQPSPRPLTFLLTMVVSSNLAKSPLSERIGSRSRNSKGACAREREEFRRNFDGIFGRKRDERGREGPVGANERVAREGSHASR